MAKHHNNVPQGSASSRQVRQPKNKKVIRLRRQFHPNVGMIMFILIAIYIGFSVFSYARRDQVKFYEVEEGSIVRENQFRGIILRDEQVVNAQTSGYLNYFVPEGKKVAKGGRVYAIDESGTLKSYMSAHASEFQQLSDADLASLRSDLAAFSRQYSDSNFGTVYDMNATLNAQVLEFASLSLFGSLSDELQQAGVSFQASTSDATGTVSYVIDGYESYTVNDVTEAMFDESAYQKQVTESGKLIESDTPAYKLITSESWNIVFPVTAEDLANLSDQTSLKIKFTDKDIQTTAAFQTMKGSDGASYGVLSLSKYLVQFEAQRFVDFEVISNDVSGLKIPDKSITSKDFYVIPSEYLVTDENGNLGFYKEVVSESGTAQQFIATDIYNNDGTECYIECTETSGLQPADYVSKPNQKDTRYQIAAQKPLQGVYNINKGYTVFKRIELLESANGYSIIKKNSSYGLSVFDHIVLDASTVGDGELIYR